MEHLMSAKERGERKTDIRDVSAIPWLGFDHDDTDHRLTTIQQYPISRGWSRADLRELELGNLGSRSATQALAMIQSWMFLGLLESAFNERFSAKDFLDTAANGHRVVQTAFLRKWIDDYHSTVILHPPNDPGQRCTQKNRLVESLEYAALWNQRLVDIEQDESRRSPLISSLLFGPVTRLITLIAEAVWAVAQLYPSPEERFFIDCDWSLTQVNNRVLRDRLRARGWCPSLYNKVGNLARTPASFLEYVSLVPPQEDTVSPHGRCSVDECVQYNIDESKYQTRHRVDGCQCRMLSPPLVDVNDALRHEKIPVINAPSLLGLDSEAIVRGHSPERPLEFVAFSHVWSDGLGSTTEEGIPECQIQYLMETSLHAAGTSMFWIDSLCIPRDRATRKLAISMMSKTYSSASATVVLGQRIKRCDFKWSLETRIVALSLSTWQERLWTLQESSLSRRVIFMFENDLVLAEKIIEESGVKIHRPVVRTAHILLDNFTNWVHTDDVTVGGLQRNLYRRTSTKPGDESLAVAPFLNIDVKPLLEVEGEERMMRFWDEVQHVPKGIIFHNLEKLSRDGYRWAPRSIMNQKNAVVLDVRDMSATVTKSGLKGVYWVYKLRTQYYIPSGRTESIFYDPLSETCLKVLESGAALNPSLNSNSVVVFERQLTPAAQNCLGVVLRRVSDGIDRSSQHIPVDEFGGPVVVILFSEAILTSMVGPELGWRGWNMMKQSTQGQFEVESTEILIR